MFSLTKERRDEEIKGIDEEIEESRKRITGLPDRHKFTENAKNIRSALITAMDAAIVCGEVLKKYPETDDAE